MQKNAKNGSWYLAGICFLLVAWQLIAVLFDSELIFPGPVDVAKKFIAAVQTEKFLASLGMSFLRVFAGLVVSVPSGVFFGVLCGLNENANQFFKPFFRLTAAVPVMSVILIAFLFLGSEKTPIFTSFLMIFPVITNNVIAGIREVSPDLKEMFASFRMTSVEKIRMLYIPSIMPYVIGSLKTSLSLSWKVVAAAEVLLQPLYGLGTGMQAAKANLETSELFAWTGAAVIAAGVSNSILSFVTRSRRKRGLA